MNLTGEGEPQRLVGVKATADYFKVYGVQPVLGRTFLPEEDAVGKNHVAVLSNPFWQRVFGGEKNIIGRNVRLNGESYTVIGVAPPDFGQQSKVDVWTTMVFTAEERDNKYRGAHYLSVAGRLQPGV